VIRWVVILIPLLLCACQGSKVRQELQRVDSLNSHDIPLDTITTMDAVVDYLDWWGTANERMTAHYLLGSVYRDQDNAPMALRCYRDAVSYADTTASDCDYHRLSRIYGQIADLFHRQRAPRLEIEAERKAVEYAWKAKDTLAAVIFYGSLCGPYHMLNDMDSVIIILEELNHICKSIGQEAISASFGVAATDVYLRRSDLSKAQAALSEYEQRSGFFDNHGNIESGREIYYKFKGLLYDKRGEKDSAEYYYRKLLRYCNDNDNATAAYQGLFSLYNQIGNADSIAKYAALYCQANDSASFRHSADELTRTHALYNYEEHERIAAMKTQEADRYRQAIFFLIVILSVAGYASYRYVKRQQRRKRAALVAANQEYHALLVQYQRLQQDMQLSQQSLDEFRDEKEREISQLIQQLSLYQDTPLLSEHWHIEQAMLDTPVISDLHHIACQAKVASNVQLKELREFVEAQLPDFFTAINNKEAMLTPQELSVSILIRLQFSQGELSALFGVSKQRINNIKRSINRKLFKSDGAVTLNDNILSLCQM
jgi:tetratricopeptide (TPR) repeat protein